MVLDARKTSNQSYPIRNWFSPSDLEEKLSQDIDKANENLANYNDSFMEDPTGLNLRDYQIKAVNKATEAIMNGSRTALLAMATGTGKHEPFLALFTKCLNPNASREFCSLLTVYPSESRQWIPLRMSS